MTGVARKTSITLSINNCRDQDGPDLQLMYTFGYKLANVLITLKLPSSSNTFSSIFPTGTVYPWIKVVDSLGDGIQYNSTIALVITSSRRRVLTEDIRDEYKQDCELHGLINTLDVYLDSYVIPYDLLEEMLDDFEDFLSKKETNEDLINAVYSVMLGFMGDMQKDSLTFANLKKYAAFITLKVQDFTDMNGNMIKNVLELGH